MTGTSITIEFDDRRIAQVLDELLRASADLSEPMMEIGETLLESTRQRFDTGRAPDGTPWEPLSEKYRQSKRKRNSRGANAILVLNDHLHGQLAYNSGKDYAEITANRIYAATHQFGDPKRNIPQREFLGFSDEDLGDIMDILNDYLSYYLP